MQNPCKRRDINSGMHVRIVEKKNQKEGITTDGIVARILTNSSEHPHGIKVQLSNGAVGRVKEIISMDETLLETSTFRAWDSGRACSQTL